MVQKLKKVLKEPKIAAECVALPGVLADGRRLPAAKFFPDVASGELVDATEIKRNYNYTSSNCRTFAYIVR